MSRKKGRRTRKPDEVFAAGPIQVARFGRLVVGRSHWDPRSREEFRNQAPAFLEEHRREIQAAIDRLTALLREYDPLCFIAQLFAANNLVDPETYTEPTHEGREVRVEYAQSLALAVETPGTSLPGDEQIEEFSKLTATVLDRMPLHIAIQRSTQVGSRDVDALGEAAFMMIMRHLFVRGSSIVEHETELLRQVFSPHDEYLRSRFGITTDDLLTGCQQISNHVEKAFNGPSWLHEVREAYEKFCTEIDARPENDPREVWRSMQANKDYAQLVTRAREDLASALPLELSGPVPLDAIRIDSLAPALPKLLPLLSARFGDNRSFLSFAKSPGWPSNDSVTWQRPLVERDGHWYCPNPVFLARQRLEILLSLVKADSTYFNDVFCPRRAELLENLAFRYLGKLLPGAQAYRNLFFRPNGPGTEPRNECDGILVLDDRLFIVEAKAGELSLSARRGSPERLKSEIKKLVTEAHSQGLRAKAHIAAGPSATFEHENGDVAVVLPGLSHFRAVYLIDVTLADLSGVVTHLNSLERVGLTKGRDWPWCVFINDLRVISDMIESPSEFVLYLERRLALNDLGMFAASDELDYLSMFLKEGLYYDDANRPDTDLFVPFGYTVDIDRYYDFVAGRVKSGAKPRLGISDEYRTLIRDVERTSKPGWVQAATSLLSLAGTAQQELLGLLAQLKTRFQSDGRPHHAVLTSANGDPIVFARVHRGAPDEAEFTCRYCEAKKIQLKAARLLCVSVEVDDEGNERLAFQIYDGPSPTHDSAVFAMARELSRATLGRHANLRGGPPGRNEPCPCGSGKKFKKCCGSLLP